MITTPRGDILTTVGFVDGPFLLLPRQELGGREANGAQPGIDFGSALWGATYTTEPLRNDDAADFQAVLNSLDGVIEVFEAWDLRRAVPRAHRDGSAQDGVLETVNANNKAMTLSGLAANQIVSRGDYLSFVYGNNRALHQAMETVAADGAGLTPEFEVRPHLRAGWALDTVVNLRAPRGLFILVPNSIQPRRVNGHIEGFTFQAGQYIR